MNEDIEYQRIVDKILEVLRQYNCTPQQVRHAFKLVRIKGKYQVPKQSKKLPDFLNAAETYYIIDLATKQSSLDGMLITLLIHSGLRINEACNLRIEHIDFNSDTLKVVQGKGSKDRFVPLSTPLKHALLYYLKERKKGYVFCKYNETQYTKRALQYRVENIIKKCNFSKQNLTTHSLRHTFACMCLSKGLPLDRIQLLMGHEKITTTQIYAKLELGTLKDEFIRLIQ